MNTQRNSCIVVGIGNPLLKDDRLGLEVVQALQAQNAAVDTAELYSAGFEVLDTILGYESAYIVDACHMGHPPGTILEMTPDELFSDEQIVNSHALTLGSTLRTGQMVFAGEMPACVKLILVQAEDTSSFSTECTPKVSQAINKIVTRLAAAKAV